VIGLGKKNIDNIEFYDSRIIEINELDGKISSIKLNDITLEVSGLFVILGSHPSTDFIEIEKKDDYILVDSNMNTSKEGIFACGDVIYKDLYQASTAVGDGARAANSAIKYLGNK
jgi:thioredoxin reductase (NADPH)